MVSDAILGLLAVGGLVAVAVGLAFCLFPGSLQRTRKTSRKRSSRRRRFRRH